MIERKSCGYEAFSFGRELPDGEKSSETYVESEALRLILEKGDEGKGSVWMKRFVHTR